MASIDIVVGGRFHSDHMAAALIEAGHDVRVITPFPKSRFPLLSKQQVVSHIFPEVFYRIFRKFGLEEFADEIKMAWFGRQAAESLRADANYVISWSSFALESFKKTKAKKILIRDSAHIELQMEILRGEYKKYGKKFIEKKVGIKRELEEYTVCDRLVVLSDFAKKSFVDRGYPANKIRKLTLGTDTNQFKPDNHSAKLPLKVVYFGTISLRKGVQYLLEAFKRIPSNIATLDLIGSVSHEFQPVKHHPHMSHEALSLKLAESDIFVFPTLEDGFGQTLLQAMASGLCPIVSENCGAGEIITRGKNGGVIPTCSSEAIYDAIIELSKNLEGLNRMRFEAARSLEGYTWKDYSKRVSDLLKDF